MADQPDTTAEEWRYAGLRHSQDGKPYSAWCDPSGRLLGYSTKGDAHRTPGAVYRVQVLREGEAGVTRYGVPQYLRMQDDDQARAWGVEEQAAVRLGGQQLAGCVAQAQRDALAAWVLGQLASAKAYHPDDFADL